ncbi:MAG: bifunctional nicotinamidase/pyrazinamidase [Deltaproteobacteria bacterium]|nr:bifunctional nicotinamidase/pyrazinamidase [Deltaproteobacteria bacterium]
MRALVLVDLQYDFMPGGALAVAHGDEVVAVAQRLIPQFETVVATQDWHPRDHKSFAANNPGANVGEVRELNALPQVMWPAHCVQGTHGAELHENLDGITQVFQKGTNAEIDSYSGFFDNGHKKATGLDGWLREQGVTELTVMGLATDYCVKYTVLDALHLGFDVTLVTEGCRAVDLAPGDGERAIAEMAAAGAQIV